MGTNKRPECRYSAFTGKAHAAGTADHGRGGVGCLRGGHFWKYSARASAVRMRGLGVLPFQILISVWNGIFEPLETCANSERGNV